MQQLQISRIGMFLQVFKIYDQCYRSFIFQPFNLTVSLTKYFYFRIRNSSNYKEL